MISILKRLFSSPDSNAQALYASIVAQSRRPEFFTEFGVPDTPIGRYEVLALHVFLVMHRLREDEAFVELARALSEEAVQDIDRNLREMGVGDLSVGRKVKSLTEGLYGRFGAYVDGLKDDGEGLQDALRRNLFADVEVSEEVVAAIAAYLRRESAALAACDAAVLAKGEVTFGTVMRH